MTRTEVNEYLKTIKAYYPDFFYDDNTFSVWSEELEKYSKEDLEERLREHLRGENRDKTPLVQNLVRGLLTPSEKLEQKEHDFTIECNLCHKWMKESEYEKHYDECLEINRLWLIGRKQNPNLKREDVESLSKEHKEALGRKYPIRQINAEELLSVKRI